MKKSYLFAFIALMLSHTMCIVTTYNYRDMLCAVEHRGFSAPAGTALLTAVPFLIGIAICIVLAVKYEKKK